MDVGLDDPVVLQFQCTWLKDQARAGSTHPIAVKGIIAQRLSEVNTKEDIPRDWEIVVGLSRGVQCCVLRNNLIVCSDCGVRLLGIPYGQEDTAVREVSTDGTGGRRSLQTILQAPCRRSLS
jgi:hypothetical protein